MLVSNNNGINRHFSKHSLSVSLPIVVDDGRYRLNKKTRRREEERIFQVNDVRMYVVSAKIIEEKLQLH